MKTPWSPLRSLAGAGLAMPVFMTAGFAGTAIALANAENEPAGGPEEQSIGLSYQAYKKWDIVLPGETWTLVTDSIPNAQSQTGGFAAEQVGPMKLRVDTNADDKLDADVKGNGGFLKLRGLDDDGDSFTYAVRFVNEGGKYKFAASGAMVGKIAGIQVRVVDQNNNGYYDDYGQDAIVVGNAKGAAFLSRVVNVGDELYEFEVTADGSRATFRPYTGPTASIDAASNHESRGKLLSAVISGQDGEWHFNVARDKQAMMVPAGSYRFAYGFVAKGGETAQMRAGKMRPIELDPGGDHTLEWGGPVVAEFEYDVDDETITVRPNVAFYGTAGEEYHTFKPDAKSPKIIVSDKKSRKIYLEGRFGGC